MEIGIHPLSLLFLSHLRSFSNIHTTLISGKQQKEKKRRGRMEIQTTSIYSHEWLLTLSLLLGFLPLWTAESNHPTHFFRFHYRYKMSLFQRYERQLSRSKIWPANHIYYKRLPAPSDREHVQDWVRIQWHRPHFLLFDRPICQNIGQKGAKKKHWRIDGARRFF